MDMKTYYKKLREVEASLPDEVVLVSKDTPEGGRAGRFTEAPRYVAARLITEGVAERASDQDAAVFAKETREGQSEELRKRAAASIQVNVISEDQARALSSTLSPKRGKQ
jgi:hypothetical protein